MSQPTLALSFADLQIRVAEFLGVADYSGGAAAVPTDPHDLDRVKRIINDGWREFAGAQPRWNWLTPTFTIQFDADGSTTRTVDDSVFPAPLQDRSIPRAARYYMPDGFYGVMISWFTYERDGPIQRIDNVNESIIREYHATAEAAGDPYMAAIRPLPTLADLTDVSNSRWELIVYPAPESADYITGRCRIFPNKLVNDGDYHAAGFQFDNVVLAACLAEAEKQQEHTAGVKQQLYMAELQKALLIDRDSKPRSLGYNGDWSDDHYRPRRVYDGVSSYFSDSAGEVAF